MSCTCETRPLQPCEEHPPCTICGVREAQHKDDEFVTFRHSWTDATLMEILHSCLSGLSELEDPEGARRLAQLILTDPEKVRQVLGEVNADLDWFQEMREADAALEAQLDAERDLD